MAHGLIAVALIMCVMSGCRGGPPAPFPSGASRVDPRVAGNERRPAEDGVILRVAWYPETHLPRFACRIVNERDGRLCCYLEPETSASGPYSHPYWNGGTEAMATLLLEYLGSEAWRAATPPSSGADAGNRMTLWVAAIQADRIQTASVTASPDRIRELVNQSPLVAQALSAVSDGLPKQYHSPWKQGGEALYSPAP